MTPPCVWTVAGVDSSGSAGIAADLKTFAAFGVHGCTVITAVTGQSSRSVRAVYPLSGQQLAEQWYALEQDQQPAAIKLAMLGNAEIVTTVCRLLTQLQQQQPALAVICDPVLAASDGTALLDSAGRHSLLGKLLPLCSLVTPNIDEAALMTGCTIRDHSGMIESARRLLDRGVKNVLITGGHLPGREVRSYFATEGNSFWICSPRSGRNMRGTGCIYSAAVTALLSSGQTLPEALVLAENHVQDVIANAFCRDGSVWRATTGSIRPARQTMPRVYTRSDHITAIGDWKFPRCQLPRHYLYPVVDSSIWIERLASCGVKVIQLRLKGSNNSSLPQDSVAATVADAVAIAERVGVRLIVNDYWQLAIDSGAWGVHLGQEDLAQADLQAIAEAGLRLGISTHCWWELCRALALNPSYIACGPVYATTSKKMTFAPLSPEGLQNMLQIVPKQCDTVAIGGIDSGNIDRVLASEVSGIALIGAICQADDWRNATNRLLDKTELHNSS